MGRRTELFECDCGCIFYYSGEMVVINNPALHYLRRYSHYAVCEGCDKVWSKEEDWHITWYPVHRPDTINSFHTNTELYQTFAQRQNLNVFLGKQTPKEVNSVLDSMVDE